MKYIVNESHDLTTGKINPSAGQTIASKVL